MSTQGETGPAKAGAAQNDQAPQGDSIPHGAVEPVVQRWDVGALAPAVPRGLIAYHPATNRLLTLQDAGAVLWDIVTGLAIRGFAADGLKSPHVTVIAFSPDGSRLLLGGRTRLRLHDAHRGEVLVEFDTEGRSILDADLSPDGQLIAAACDDAVVRIWDAHNGSLQRQLREHRWTLTHVRFSPDSSQLLSGGTDRLAVLWDVKSGRLIHRLASPTDVRGTAFSSDGKRLLTYGSGEYWHTVRAVV